MKRLTGIQTGPLDRTHRDHRGHELVEFFSLSPAVGGERRGEGESSARMGEYVLTMVTHRTIRTALCIFVFAARLVAAEPIDYSNIESIFTTHCLDCHGSTEPEGKLVMETHELLLKGGESGAVIIPGKSDESLLVRMIEGKVEQDGKKKLMPPGKREKLKAEEIALIRAWIDAGAIRSMPLLTNPAGN